MLFNEFYGRYYHILYKLLTMAYDGPLSEADMLQVINEDGYAETSFHMMPKLVDASQKDNYQLFQKTDEGYASILFYKPERHMTVLEKQWIKSLLNDRRIGLFFSECQIAALEEAFADVEPLIPNDSYRMVGQAGDGDDYLSSQYRKVFRQILCCIQKRTLMKVRYKNRYGNKRQDYFVPYRLEYSVKDDKFRLNVVRVERGKMVDYSRINVARILDIQQIHEANVPDNVEEYVKSHLAPEPVEIELRDVRNGFDRCFVHLSGYERSAEFDEETGKCNLKIYYAEFEETELLIHLMSYGPILKVVGPDSFRRQFVERLRRQRELIK